MKNIHKLKLASAKIDLAKKELAIIAEQISVYELGEFTTRTKNCFDNGNIKTVADLISNTEKNMLQRRNFGRKELERVKSILAIHGLKFCA